MQYGVTKCVAQQMLMKFTKVGKMEDKIQVLKQNLTVVSFFTRVFPRGKTEYQEECHEIAAVARYGISTLLKTAEVNASVHQCWPLAVHLKMLSEAWPELTEDVKTIINTPGLCSLVPHTTLQSSAQLLVLGPPTGEL